MLLAIWNFLLDINEKRLEVLTTNKNRKRIIVMEILSVTETVVQHLRDLIISNTFKSGQRLNEVDLSTELNVSRVPVREAFHILENEQLLVRFPRKGTYVTEMSIERLRKVYSARKMIESYAIDLLKSEQIRNLPSLYASVVQVSTLPAHNRDNPKEVLSYLKDITDFHVQLVASTRNPWIINFYTSIINNLARFQFFCRFTPGLSDQSQDTHEQIYELLAAGLYEKAKDMLMSHIDYTMGFIENHINEESNVSQNRVRPTRGNSTSDTIATLRGRQL